MDRARCWILLALVGAAPVVACDADVATETVAGQADIALPMCTRAPTNKFALYAPPLPASPGFAGAKGGYLQAPNGGGYLAFPGGNLTVPTDHPNLGTWEMFRFEGLPTGGIGIQTVFGSWVGVSDAVAPSGAFASDAVQAPVAAVPISIFSVPGRAQPTFALRVEDAARGYPFLTVERSESSTLPVVANRKDVQAWEEFQIQCIYGEGGDPCDDFTDCQVGSCENVDGVSWKVCTSGDIHT